MLDVELVQTNDDYWEPKWPSRVVQHSRVYFIRAIGTDLVKVGFSDDIKRRLKELQTASPHKLEIEMTIVGTPALEAETHRRLTARKMHVRGEWFRMHPDQVKWIVDDLWMDGLVWS